ncbi:hypothetical protein CCR75_005316 [Bremia lactucae]|uniref:Uncharacterized protein n=1 Tax=Bremia lactucae TaxID=4779 RepID=A0A976ICY4_BRELC|nr:hypothetical protein CCR75_005316 [Bremia lactucae]
MSIRVRSQLFSIRLQSPKFGVRGVSTVKTRLQPRAFSRISQIAVTGAVLSASASLLFKNSAQCQVGMLLSAAEGPSGSGGPAKKGDSFEQMIDVVLANCGGLTLAGGLGFCSGYALKQVGKAAALAVGIFFIVGQAAAYSGYIEINWGKVQKDMNKQVDHNGDGKIDSKDVKLWYRKLYTILKKNLSSSAGFSTGFALGIYCS